MKTEVDVPNPTLVLVPGMYAEVDLVHGAAKHVLTVPVEAVDGAGKLCACLHGPTIRPIQIVPVGLGDRDCAPDRDPIR